MSIGFYELLQVSPDSSPETIRSAYQEQVAQVVRKARAAEARQQDLATVEARRQNLAEAYAVLSDPLRRRRYDRFREISKGTLPGDAEELWNLASPSLVDPAAAAALEVVRTLTELKVGEPLGGRPEAEAPRPEVRIRTEAPRPEPPKVEARPEPRVEPAPPPRAEPSKAEPPRPEASRPRPPSPAKVSLPPTKASMPPARPPAGPSRVIVPSRASIPPQLERNYDAAVMEVIDDEEVMELAPAARVAVPRNPEPSRPPQIDPSRLEPARAEVRVDESRPARAEAKEPSRPKTKAFSAEDIARMVDQYSTTGTCLRVVREARGITLQELSHTTRISQRFLEALEKDAYHDLPAATFVRGYVKMVARMLHLVGNGPELDEFVDGYMARFHRNRG